MEVAVVNRQPETVILFRFRASAPKGVAYGFRFPGIGTEWCGVLHPRDHQEEHPGEYCEEGAREGRLRHRYAAQVEERP